MIQSYRDLEVWKLSIELVKEIYLITKNFPKEELYGITSQMRKAAVSIPSNIAEGKSRQSINEYIQFLYIALGSTAELETQTIISKELLFISEESGKKILNNLGVVAKMLRNLTKNLKRHL